MLVFSEGVPRSGKSYDAVKTHILAALKKGRPVIARLNGLDHEKIAEYLGMPLTRCQELLQLIDTKDVKDTYKAVQDDSGKWFLPDRFKNALCVIDEVHEFYVGGTREPLDPASEQFFALHGHYGADILVISQYYKRVHPAVRMRVERKNTFQKLSALGKKGEGMYLVRMYQTVVPDKYELVGKETRKYDSAIFALYHGILDGGDSGVTQEVYSAGRTNVWKSMMIRAALVVPLGLFSIYYLLDFFTGGGEKLVKQTKAGSSVSQVNVAPSASVPDGVVYQPDNPQPAQVKEPPKPDPTPEQLRREALAKLPAAARYLFDLASNSRVRLAARWQGHLREEGLLEFVDNQGIVIERMTVEQVRALGFDAVFHPYGLHLQAGEQEMIATQWPLNQPLRDERPELYNTAGRGDGLAVSASEPRAVTSPNTGGVSIAMPTGVGNGAIVESKLNPIGGI